jgi:hypothetical protein
MKYLYPSLVSFKPACLIFCVMLVYLCNPPTISAQGGNTGYDTVRIQKPEKGDRNQYVFVYEGSRQIGLNMVNPVLITPEKKKGLKNFGSGLFTLMTGINSNTSTDGLWNFKGSLNYNSSEPSWNLDIYCSGYSEKQRERTRNSDGSSSVETNVTNVYKWEKGATGIIVAGADTAGYFRISMDPANDSVMKSLAENVFAEDKGAKTNKPKFSASWIPSPVADFGIEGQVNNQKFIMIRNGISRKVWIWENEKLLCIFQSDITEKGIAKKYRIQPYFLIARGLKGEELDDIFRLAWVSRMVSVCIMPSY